MLRLCLIIAIAAGGHACLAQQVLPYKDARLPVDQRVKDLLQRMTPAEKFFQMFMIPGDLDHLDEAGQFDHGIFGLQVSAASKGGGETQQLLTYHVKEDAMRLVTKINGIQRHFVEKTRLGIPIIAFDESLHGLVREGATAFPQAIALAATFDTLLMGEVAAAIAMEAKARGIRQVLSPVINIATDVRWGRVEETYGEDPVLTSAMALAYVRAFEKRSIITTPKHFIANVGDGGRDSYAIHDNIRLLEEIHFPPFKACFQLGGSRSVMTSYNSYDGSACTANAWLLTAKLKQDWGFRGFVISDANATGGTVVLHNTAKDFQDAARQSVSSGLDVIFQTEYRHHKLFDEALLHAQRDITRIDDAVSRILRAKFELGLFDKPYIDEKMVTLIDQKKHKAIAKKAALESIVLLKNGSNLLPLRKGKTIAVIGEDATEARLGGYSGPGNEPVSILQGIQSRQKEKVLFAEGCKRRPQPWTVVPAEALSNGEAKGLQAEYFTNISLDGKAAVMKQVDNVDFQWTLSSPDPSIAPHFYSARWTGQVRSPKSGRFKMGIDGNDGFRLYIDDRLVIDRWNKQSYHTALSDVTFDAGRRYNIKVEFFEPVGNGRIRLVWTVDNDIHEDAMIEEAVRVTQRSDVAIVVAGIHEGEFQDRALLSLPGRQEELIQKMAETGKPVVVILVGGSAITMSRWIDQVDAILDVWYPGEEGGNAVAEILFGEHSPSGKLPITFPVHEGQLPLVYNHKPTGRGDDYHNMSGLPLFPFGFGLSYTTFEYSDLQFNKTSMRKDEVATVSFKIRNAGAYAGDEVCQLYMTDVLASVARPVTELKGFQRVHLRPGEQKTLTFALTPDLFQMLDKDLHRVVEPGEFRIAIGSSSRDIRLQAAWLVTD